MRKGYTTETSLMLKNPKYILVSNYKYFNKIVSYHRFIKPKKTHNRIGFWHV